MTASLNIRADYKCLDKLSLALLSELLLPATVVTRPAHISGAMTKLEASMESIIMIFHDYSSEDKNGKTLNKKELKKLLENELPGFLKRNPNAVDSIIKDLDQNKDDKINFEEFIGFLAGLSNACEKLYNLSQKKAKH